MIDDEYGDGAEPEDSLSASIRARYQEIAAGAGRDGISRKEIIDQISGELAGGGRQAGPELWRALVDKNVQIHDGRVRGRVHRDVEYVLAALRDPASTILGLDDPVLQLPVPGVEPGDRITLLYAPPPVLLRLVTDRTQHAKEASEAAHRIAVVVTGLLDELGRREATCVYDVLTGGDRS